MGQAKVRGTLEVRKQNATERQRIEKENQAEWDKAHPRKPISPIMAAWLALGLDAQEKYFK